MIRISFLFVFTAVCLTSALWADEPVDLIEASVSSDEAMSQIRAGEILVENANTSDAGGSVRVQALVKGNMLDLWDFIASCDATFYYVQGLKSCNVLSVIRDNDGDTTKVQQSVKKSWIVPKMDYVMEVRRQPMRRVDFQLVEGDLDLMQGGWRFKELENEDLFIVTHEIRVKPSFPVPRWLIRRSMRKDLPDMLACLRGLVDGSVTVARKDDLRRCPKSAKKLESKTSR
jgi:ribosome-associated toxin RatA of RatAB toxin-antitoxin module